MFFTLTAFIQNLSQKIRWTTKSNFCLAISFFLTNSFVATIKLQSAPSKRDDHRIQIRHIRQYLTIASVMSVVALSFHYNIFACFCTIYCLLWICENFPMILDEIYFTRMIYIQLTFQDHVNRQGSQISWCKGHQLSWWLTKATCQSIIITGIMQSANDARTRGALMKSI